MTHSTRCQFCGAAVEWLRLPRSISWALFDVKGGEHRETCPEHERWVSPKYEPDPPLLRLVQ